jgi:MerE protein
MPLLHTSVPPETHPAVTGTTAGQRGGAATDLERRGRWWLVASFLACPCHLPITLAVLGTVLGGTAAGVALREHTLIAGLLIAAVWIAGTARGLLLVRRAEREGFACRL